MQFSISKTKTFAVITMTLLMASVVLMAMPVGGQELPYYGEDLPDLKPLPAGVTPDHEITTVAYLSFTPNPIGVGQSLLVNIWSSPGMYHAFFMCDYKVTIEDPDGNQEVRTMDSYLGDATAWFEFVPDQAGTWRLKFEQPGTYLPVGIYDDRPGQPPGGFFDIGNYTLLESVWYKPSSTEWQELTVQTDYVLSWPQYAPPTDYWTRPVEVELREWTKYIGNWPWSSVIYYPGGRILYPGNYKYTPYVTAPNTAHIAWKRLGAIAGLVGGGYGYEALTGVSYQPDIIFQGRAYEDYVKPGTGGTTYWRCYDIRTGELYWEMPAQTVTTMGFFGPSVTAVVPTAISYDLGTIEVPGAEAREGFTAVLVGVVGGRLYKWNPWTGAITLNVTAMSTQTSGAGFFGAGAGGWLYNDPYTLSIQNIGNFTAPNYRLINWTTSGSTSTFANRIMNNITWPFSSLGTADFDEGVAVNGMWADPPGPQWCIGHDMWAVDLYTGGILWESHTNDTVEENVQSFSTVTVDRGKVAFGAHGRHWTCWKLRAEEPTRLWISEQTAYPWGAWFPYATASYDFNETKGAIITSTYEGVYAIDWDDGSIIWHYTDPSVPFEGPYGATPFFSGVQIADGKVYAWNTEHTPSAPITRGWKIYCIDVNTGKLIWKCGTPGSPGAIADGYLTVASTYDGYMYVYGKGKSATTVSAPETTVPLGTPVLIKGTVLDQSPAQPDTPCVSKDSMTLQMEYLHNQQPITGIWQNETITGVPVILTAISEDLDVIDLGTVTTNGYYGTFSHAWTPPEEGVYTIMVSFNGDDSYGSSTAATAVSVGPAPPTSPSEEDIQAVVHAEIPADNTPMLLGLMAAVAVAIVIGIVNLWALIKK